jgi:ligand-binding sensor domain-containing protein/anti-sigma regulatory factor (Ser/Thr protein kinase)
LLWLILFHQHQLTAQSKELFFENYTSQNGLSQNSCFAIAQDANGFMWFGTQDGLNRFDGKEFRTFLPQNEFGKKLPSNYISSLFYDTHKNLLWVGTIRGACIYHPVRDSLVAITELFPSATLLQTVPVKKIISFSKNEYWFVTHNNGLLLLNTQTGAVHSFFNDEANRAKVNSIVLHKGQLIVGVLQHLYHVNKVNGNYQVQPLMQQHSFPEIRELYSYRDALWIGTLTKGCYFIQDSDSSIHSFNTTSVGIGCFATDRAGNLWIGTRGNGLFRYDPNTQTIQTATYNKYDNRTIGKNFVLCLLPDRQNIMWCGLSGGGVAKYDPLKYQFTSFSNEPVNAASLPDNMIFDIYKSAAGQYYIGTQNKGLVQWNKNTNSFHAYPELSTFDVACNTVYDMTEDNAENLWIASWGGLLQLNRDRKQVSFYDDKDLLTSKKLYVVHKLKNADSLFITGENGPVFFSLKDKQWKPCTDSLLQKNAYIGRYIYEDDNHVLWICTTGAGLVQFDYSKGQFQIIEPVRKYSAYARYLLRDGHLFWLATDNGIVLYDVNKKAVVKHITINQANASNVCYAIQKDAKGFFWVSTNSGLYKINGHTYNIQNYDLGNGLSFLEYNTACILTEADGTLLFGGVGGITAFNPSQLKENVFSPDPLITGMQVNGSPWPFQASSETEQEMTFNHRQNFITLQFAVNNFSNHNKNQFAYRLPGLNDQWIYCGNNNTVNYNSLPPGHYRFQLRAANSDGKWSKSKTILAFTIRPPWWQTWWFRISALLTIGGIITWLVRRRVRNIRHEAELKHRIAETEMMALRAQMNPHFIFNCINSIDALILSNDKYHATMYLNKFAKLLRNILDSSKQNMVTLTKDLETLQLYIDLEQLREENKFTVHIEAEDVLLQDDFKVPPLIVQPYVENAIIHGLKPRADNNGRLLIKVSKQQDHIEYVIEDNGVGRHATHHGMRKEVSYGMQMSRDRVKFFNNEEDASVVVTDLKNNGEPAGTKVQVLLKIQ